MYNNTLMIAGALLLVGVLEIAFAASRAHCALDYDCLRRERRAETEVAFATFAAAAGVGTYSLVEAFWVVAAAVALGALGSTALFFASVGAAPRRFD